MVSLRLALAGVAILAWTGLACRSMAMSSDQLIESQLDEIEMRSCLGSQTSGYFCRVDSLCTSEDSPSCPSCTSKEVGSPCKSNIRTWYAPKRCVQLAGAPACSPAELNYVYCSTYKDCNCYLVGGTPTCVPGALQKDCKYIDPGLNECSITVCSYP